ncbi:MAG: hypothetical protein Q9218_005180 [Villophora microphyllina]
MGFSKMGFFKARVSTMDINLDDFFGGQGVTDLDDEEFSPCTTTAIDLDDEEYTPCITTTTINLDDFFDGQAVTDLDGDEPDCQPVSALCRKQYIFDTDANFLLNFIPPPPTNTQPPRRAFIPSSLSTMMLVDDEEEECSSSDEEDYPSTGATTPEVVEPYSPQMAIIYDLIPTAPHPTTSLPDSAQIAIIYDHISLPPATNSLLPDSPQMALIYDTTSPTASPTTASLPDSAQIAIIYDKPWIDGPDILSSVSPPPQLPDNGGPLSHHASTFATLVIGCAFLGSLVW